MLLNRISSQYKGELLMVLVSIVGGIAWLFSSTALQAVPPFMFVGVRFLLAGILLGLIGRHALLNMGWSQIKGAIGSGLILAVAMLSWVLGLFHATSMGESAFIASLSVIIIPLVGFIIYKSRITPIFFLSMLVAVVGLGFLCFGKSGSDAGFNINISQFYLLVSALALALHFVITAKQIGNTSPLALSAIQLFVVGVLGLGFEIFPALVRGESVQFDWGVNAWTALITSSILGSVLRYSLQGQALRSCSANHAGMILTLEPIWVSLLGAIFLGQLMAFNQWVGCGLIFASMLIFQLNRKG